MKILHVIPAIAQRYGGPSLAVVEMCRALREAGAEVLIATTNADGAGVLPVELGRETVYQGVPAIFFQRQWSEAYKYSRPLAQWLKAHVDEFDLIHIHAVFSHSSLTAARACRLKDTPYILRPLGSLAPWSLNNKRARKEIFWRLGVKQLIAGAKAIHYTTGQEKDLAEKSIESGRGVVIPLGVAYTPKANISGDIFRKSLPELSASNYVLVMSRLHHVKGLELLIDGFLSLDLPDWQLVLAGEGETGYVNSLTRLVEEKNGTGRVLFAGWLAGDIKESALCGAALLALTSFQENFGLCVVEALACGVPVFLSENVGIAPDVAVGGVGWVTRLESAELARHLADALRDETARQTKGAAGPEFAQRYSWPIIAHELLELYQSVRILRT